VQVHQLVSKKKKKPQHELKMKGTHCGTFIPFVSATGELILTYFILSVKLDENGEADVPIDIPSIFVCTQKGMAAPHIFFNESGYLNGEIFPQIIDHFIRTWKLKHPRLHCCLLGDNVSAHRDLKVIKKGLDNGVYLNFLVENTTHWFQPLDNLLFT
jgi:hypothetical protein